MCLFLLSKISFLKNLSHLFNKLILMGYDCGHTIFRVVQHIPTFIFEKHIIFKFYYIII